MQNLMQKDDGTWVCNAASQCKTERINRVKGEEKMCRRHGKLRTLRNLKQDENGEYTCLNNSRCKGADPVGTGTAVGYGGGYGRFSGYGGGFGRQGGYDDVFHGSHRGRGQRSRGFNFSKGRGGGRGIGQIGFGTGSNRGGYGNYWSS